MKSDEEEDDDTSKYFSILPKIFRLQTLLAELAGLDLEEMKPSEMWGNQGVNDSEVEETSERIYRRAWKVKKVADDDNGPMFVWALCVVVEHLTQCYQRNEHELTTLDKKIVSMMAISLHSIHGKFYKKQDLVSLMDNLKLSLFKEIDFVASIALYCNIDGSRREGDFDCTHEREDEYLELLSG